jgi:GNAT superfamily N-acetyltransferase
LEVAHSLKSPSTTEEWHAYHSIRRRVLWEARGRFGVYDDTHPDEHKAGHFPKLLIFEGAPIGVIRIDIAKSISWFRRVAIIESLQRRGHGSQLIKLAEEFVRRRGVLRIQSDVDQDAIPFYERFGFRLVDSDGTVMFKEL